MPADPMTQLSAIAQGGKSAGDAYAAAANQMGSDRAAALASALGRTQGIQGPAAPAAFQTSIEPRIAGAFDAKIPELQALSSAAAARGGAISGAVQQHQAGLGNLISLLGQQEAAKYAPGSKAMNSLVNSDVNNALAPMRYQSELEGYQTKAATTPNTLASAAQKQNTNAGIAKMLKENGQDQVIRLYQIATNPGSNTLYTSGSKKGQVDINTSRQMALKAQQQLAEYGLKLSDITANAGNIFGYYANQGQ